MKKLYQYTVINQPWPNVIGGGGGGGRSKREKIRTGTICKIVIQQQVLLCITNGISHFGVILCNLCGGGGVMGHCRLHKDYISVTSLHYDSNLINTNLLLFCR